MAKIKPILTPEEERQQNLEQLAKYRPLDGAFHEMCDNCKITFGDAMQYVLK